MLILSFFILLFPSTSSLKDCESNFSIPVPSGCPTQDAPHSPHNPHPSPYLPHPTLIDKHPPGRLEGLNLRADRGAVEVVSLELLPVEVLHKIHLIHLTTTPFTLPPPPYPQ